LILFNADTPDLSMLKVISDLSEGAEALLKLNGLSVKSAQFVR